MSRVVMVGFETGDLSELVAGGSAGNGAIESVYVNPGGGAYSVRYVSSGSNSGWCTLTPPLSTFYYKVWMNVPSGVPPSTSSGLVIVAPYNGTANAGQVWLVAETNGSWKIFIQDTTGANIGFVPVNYVPGTWACFEVIFTIGAGTGSVSVYKDGLLVANPTNQQLGSATITTVNIGWSYGDNGRLCFYDDIEVDNATLCGQSVIIARQGKTGTPTYNGWTKSSGTDASALWSDTPFNATTNCNSGSITTALAQTMLTASFATTQPGDGPGIITNLDTIKGIKVGAVAKINTATAGSGAIRQRFNSVDTDSASISLTTADVYYEGAIFTDTLANLNASEIGFNKLATGVARTVTVEDVWIHASYLKGADTSFIGYGWASSEF